MTTGWLNFPASVTHQCLSSTLLRTPQPRFTSCSHCWSQIPSSDVIASPMLCPANCHVFACFPFLLKMWLNSEDKGPALTGNLVLRFHPHVVHSSYTVHFLSHSSLPAHSYWPGTLVQFYSFSHMGCCFLQKLSQSPQYRVTANFTSRSTTLIKVTFSHHTTSFTYFIASSLRDIFLCSAWIKWILIKYLTELIYYPFFGLCKTFLKVSLNIFLGKEKTLSSSWKFSYVGE